MDYNHNGNNGQRDPNNMNNGYNQSTGPKKQDGFAIASMVCGIVSLVLCCTGVLSLPLGALGILFAVLTRRKGQSMSTMSLAGLWLSSVGMALGVMICINVFRSIPSMLNDPIYREGLDSAYERIYGEDFAEFWENNYGIEFK